MFPELTLEGAHVRLEPLSAAHVPALVAAASGARAPPQPPDAVEIGWTWLAADAQRTAANSDAKLLMLTHAFEAWHVVRVNLRTDARNAGSRAAIERLGAKLDGILRAHVPGSDGAIRDTATYSLLSSEWPAAKAALSRALRQR